MPFYTPLRYPGGKTKLAPTIKKIIEANNLVGGTYIEPYSGGAGIALTLLIEGYVRYIIINDKDPVIYAFWATLLKNPKEFCERIKEVPITIEEWQKQKKINRSVGEYSEEEIGFSTFFLNRTNRSGIIRGGVIGGVHQTGNYKIDARFKKDKLIERIKLIAKYKDKISVYDKDALELIGQVKIKTPKKVLYYFDPPYFNKGQTLYKNSYTHDDHAQVATRIQELKLPWVVTYDNVPEIKSLYNSSATMDFTINYYACKVMKGKEVLFYNNLNFPKDHQLKS